jgi:NTE family protein
MAGPGRGRELSREQRSIDGARKIALVCGGGGLTGGVFELGALRALDRALGGGVLADLDCYVGASAGALVATLMAAGASPEDMEDVLVRGGRRRSKLPELKRTSIYGVDVGSWLGAAARLPIQMSRGFLLSLLPGDSSRPADALFEAFGCLPPGVFSNEPIARYLKEALLALGYADSFESLPVSLFVTAVNLDTSTRVVFGEQGQRNLTISKAVQASSALPVLFRPVSIGEQEFVDGGIEQNLPVDVAVRHGAGLIIAVNPLVPVVNDPRKGRSLLDGERHISGRGLPAVLDQVFRMLIRSQVLYGLQAMRNRYPEVDIVLLEPEAHDWRMFSYHPMRYSVRKQLAAHAYKVTSDRLVRDSGQLEAVFARHGLDFQAQRLERDDPRSRRGGSARWLLRKLGSAPILRGFAEAEDTVDPFR